jgi:hypothetical protein
MFRPSFLSFAPALVAALSLGLTSCDTPVGQGAGIGAATGAIIGGAAAGAAAGALAGGLIGAAVQQNQAAAYGPPPPGGYPVATPTERAGFVISPYAPYYEIDTRGAPRGALIRDPSCGRLFIKP